MQKTNMSEFWAMVLFATAIALAAVAAIAVALQLVNIVKGDRLNRCQVQKTRYKLYSLNL